MKEIVYLIIGVLLMVLVGGALMRGTEQLDDAAGDGAIDQQELSDSLHETIGPEPDVTTVLSDDDPESGEGGVPGESEGDEPEDTEGDLPALTPSGIED